MTNFPEHTLLEVSSNPEILDFLVQVSLIRIGAQRCRTETLQEQDWTTLNLLGNLFHSITD